ASPCSLLVPYSTLFRSLVRQGHRPLPSGRNVQVRPFLGRGVGAAGPWWARAPQGQVQFKVGAATPNWGGGPGQPRGGRGTATRCGGWVDTAPPFWSWGGQTWRASDGTDSPEVCLGGIGVSSQPPRSEW